MALFHFFKYLSLSLEFIFGFHDFDLIKEFSLNDVVSGTVHRFQGDQKDIVIFDIPDSEGVFPSPLINAASSREQGVKLMNVAFSRSKDILIV